jgi:hypothetical protein
MKALAQLKTFIPNSSLGKKVSFLIVCIFLILPFQTPILHKTFKKLSLSIIPSALSLPDYFPAKIAFFPSEFLLLALFCVVIRKRWIAFFWIGPSKYLTLLFSTALISLTLSSTSTYLLLYTRFIEVALILILFNSIRIAFDSDTVIPFIRFLAWIIFAIALFESSIALLQFFSQKSLGLKCVGEFVTQSAFYVPGAQRWIFDHTQRAQEFLLRASGTFPHANIFGGFLFCTLLNTFYLYFTSAHKKMLLLGIFLQIPALVLSFSRSALIAFCITTLLWFFFQFRYRRKAVLQLACILFSLAALCLFLLYPQLSARGGIFNYNKLVQGADAERVLYQKIAVDMVKEHPLLGIGLNNFQIESPRFSPEGALLASRVHSIYLLLAAETGLIGMSFFLLFLFSILRHARCALQTQEGVFLLMLFAGFLFIGACDFYLFCTPHGQILFFGPAALLYLVASLKKSA